MNYGYQNQYLETDVQDNPGRISRALPLVNRKSLDFPGERCDEQPNIGENTKEQNLSKALKKKPRWGESVIRIFLLLCSVFSILVSVGIVYELGKESLLFFTLRQWEDSNKSLSVKLDSSAVNDIRLSKGGRQISVGQIIRLQDEAMQILAVEDGVYSVERGSLGTQPSVHPAGTAVELSTKVTLGEFFSETEWNPQIGKFGIWPLVNATLMTSLIAILVAIPVGLSIAIYLSEYALPRVRKILKPTLEILAGIPTVVYGYFALTFMTPLLRAVFGNDVVGIYNTASAGIVIGILIIPIISSISEDTLHAVPRSLREASYALGATRLETTVKVVLPAAISGIASAILLAVSRAIGETMVVAIAAGAGPAFTFNPFKPAETMTGHIVRISGGDLSYNTLDYNSIFAIGLLLFVMTMFINLISRLVVRRFREVYE